MSQFIWHEAKMHKISLLLVLLLHVVFLHIQHNTTQLETEKFKSYYITQGNKHQKKKTEKMLQKKIEKIKPTSCEIILNIMLGIGAIFVRHCWYELKANIT